MTAKRPTDHVFLNHPLDSDYVPMRDALVFAVYDCGFVARSALEASDASEARLDKIYRLIDESRYGIHDVSRIELNAKGLPRFNMPFELGIFLGCKRYGGPHHRNKACLVLERMKYLSKEYLSDLGGADVEAHGGEPARAITAVRTFLNKSSNRKSIPTAQSIRNRYRAFRADLPTILAEQELDEDDLDFYDLSKVITEWLRAHAR